MTVSAWYRPTHAHVPGQNARHAEDAFEHIRASARPGMTPADLAESDAFRHGLFYLDSGFYWEAHEVLEPIWMALPEGLDRRFVQGLIQTANAFLKQEMNRPGAARRLCGIARGLLPASREAWVMGIGAERIHAILDSLEADL
ncbi:DUF309 domain-containing protein [uncultured Mameliella sp.]|uniref:DUF309 domain-containing protein n=1 Tax=uncultured Mameliella sp. TaxID=1447087 RepID=UPI002626E7A4|nr:DUF309 domain-containing protein [uncultured Mameliella sp.]